MNQQLTLSIRDSAHARRRLRIALTEACNLGCFFCHAEAGDVRHFQAPLSDLQPADIATAITLAGSCGVTSVKLTGGEPLLYRSAGGDVLSAVAAAADAASRAHIELSLVTNGIGLTPDRARQLRQMGLRRVTISLHAGSPSTFARYAGLKPGSSMYSRVVRGIAAAVDAGLDPVKINTVVYHSRADSSLRNTAELPRILEVARQLGVSEVKFFVLLQNRRLSERIHSDSYVFWTDRVLDDVLPEAALRRMRRLLEDQRLETYAAPGSFSASFDVSGRPDRNFRIAFQNLRLRKSIVGTSQCHCQEGSYALRLLSSGYLKACLMDPEHRDLATLLRRNDILAAESLFREGLSRMHDREVVAEIASVA